MKRLLLLAAILLHSCGHRKLLSPEDALLYSSTPAALSDDLGKESLISALDSNIKILLTNPPTELRFGKRKLSSHTYAHALKNLMQVAQMQSSTEIWIDFIRQNFDFYSVFGNKEPGEAFITSYYDPIIQGSLKESKKYSQPLYITPNDLVLIRMNDFIEKFPALESIRDKLGEQKSGSGVLRGRLINNTSLQTPEIVPYFSREEIDSQKLLKGKKLELCYVDPVDAFTLQIQGSGIVRLENGQELRIGYASQNGHPYVAIGKHLTHIIPLKEMTLQKIETYLHTLPPLELQQYLNKNPSYVFFRKLDGNSVGSLGAEVVAGRTIATDPRYFPKGALAFIEFSKPIFRDQANLATEWKNVQRFVLDQDTGGAIRGPDRLDLYWGKGDSAKQAAGNIKHWGKLSYLVPKEVYLAQLKNSP